MVALSIAHIKKLGGSNQFGTPVTYLRSGPPSTWPATSRGSSSTWQGRTVTSSKTGFVFFSSLFVYLSLFLLIFFGQCLFITHVCNRLSSCPSSHQCLYIVSCVDQLFVVFLLLFVIVVIVEDNVVIIMHFYCCSSVYYVFVATFESRERERERERERGKKFLWRLFP